MGDGTKAYKMKVRPIILKELAAACDWTHQQLAETAGVKRPTLHITLNRGYIPLRHRGFKKLIEDKVRSTPQAIQWLLMRGLRTEDIWNPTNGQTRRLRPAGHAMRSLLGRRHKAIAPGNPEAVTIDWEVEMITEETKRHFKLFKNPFMHDILDDRDIFMTDEHRYIEAAMLDAAKHAGFLAVVGEVQSGKSVMRRRIVMQLQREDNVCVIFPTIIDKTRVSASSIAEAIINDISSEKAKIRHEQQARQVHRLLLHRHKQGYRHVLIIEEAHDLSFTILKLLKRFYELEDGYEKLLGIILIGQLELKEKFNEAQHLYMREVIRRVQIAEIKGLNGDIKEYLLFKFKRINADAAKVFTDGAIEALGKRMMTKDSRTGKSISHAFPGLVNNYAAKTMNLAYEMGEKMVSEAVVLAI